jgi:hypothetical protein
MYPGAGTADVDLGTFVGGCVVGAATVLGALLIATGSLALAV